MSTNPLQPTDLDLLSAAIHTPDADASDEGVAALLSHDPLGTVEDKTGSYRDNPALGFAYVGVHGARKDRVLNERGDTTFTMETQAYIDVIEDYGFELLLSDTATVDKHGDVRDESWFIYGREEDGMLLFFDTYKGQRNAASVYYKWRPRKDLESYWPYTSSGGMEDNGVWIGDHDAREAVVFNMERLRKNGKFVKTTKTPVRVWFISHWETPDNYDRDFDYDAITEAKVAQLPRKYQRMLGR